MRRKVWVEEESRMPYGSEFQTGGCNTETIRDAKVVQTRGTDNRLVLAERRERVVAGNSERSGGKQAEWSRECCALAWQVNFMHCSIGNQ